MPFSSSRRIAVPEFRSQGLGGQSLAGLRELCACRGRYILLETEDVDYARNSKQKAERQRRDDFYRHNGCVKTDVKGTIFTVHYAIWILGAPAELADKDDVATSATGRFKDADNVNKYQALFDRACADMRTLYQSMIPGEKNSLFVKIGRSS